MLEESQVKAIRRMPLRSRSAGPAVRWAAIAVALVGLATAAHAADPAPAAAPAAAPPQVAAEPAPEAPPADNASLYCRNIANAAADARYARQANALKALEKDVDDRLAKLEAKRAEFEDWMKRRQDFLDKADGAVVAIYSQMRPDAAAQQIAVMEPEAAAAILARLNPRIASSILNEMSASVAAMLTTVMAGMPALKPPSPAG